MKKLGFIFSMFILVIFSACRKDVNDIDIDTTSPDPTLEDYTPPLKNIVGSVIGFVVDEDNTPVGQAIVSLNDQTTTTDDYGHFFFENQTMNALGALVNIEKDGYFEGSRRFFPKEGEQNRVKIQLLEKSLGFSFSAEDGGTVTMGDASVEFSAASIQTADGSAYNGIVHVAAKWLDPSLSATLDQMPGNLQGVNLEVEQVALGTYGMIVVELEGDSGEMLNIAEGSTAQVTMPVPSNLLNDAPAEIPLWSYNEEHGLWVEESTATLQSGKYVGSVSHFSFWNCDVPYDLVEFSITLLDNNTNAFSNYQVQLTLSSESITGYGYTDSNGNVSGLVPAGQELTLEIVGACGEVIYSSLIGPFSNDTDLGVLTISDANLNNTTLTGNLLDCTGIPVTNGLVIASFEGHNVYHYASTPNFTMTFTTCSASGDIEVIGVDLTNFEQSNVLTASPNTQTDLGDISACGNQIENYISITVDGVTEVFLNATSTLSNNTFIESQGGNDYYIGFEFEGISTGDYSTANGIELISSTSSSWNLFSSEGFTSFEVTAYDTNIIGTFSGDLDNNGTTVSVSGEFNITQ